MKTIGLIGGTTWHSTIDYYKLLNEGINKKLGGLHTARVIINSADYQLLVEWSNAGNWDDVTNYVVKLVHGLERAGADCLLLGANTLHKIAPNLYPQINIPLIHIAEATAKVIKDKGLKRVGLLGTKYTMASDFYPSILNKHGIRLIIPENPDMDIIHSSIIQEFSKGIFSENAKHEYLRIIENMAGQGAEGMILGCTEIPIIVKQKDCKIPLFDTTKIHVDAAIEFALG